MQPQEYVGIDLHRRRSVIVRRSAEGETLEVTKVDNDDLLAFERAVTAAGEHPEVVLEACYGWYWATDLLEELGCKVHLAHPLGNNWGNRRVKNDTRDAEDLADLLRLGRLAEAWIAPPKVRELRELVRYRAKLVSLRTNCKLQVYAVLGQRRRLRPDDGPVRRLRHRAFGDLPPRHGLSHPCRVAPGPDRGLRP